MIKYLSQINQLNKEFTYYQTSRTFLNILQQLKAESKIFSDNKNKDIDKLKNEILNEIKFNSPSFSAQHK